MSTLYWLRIARRAKLYRQPEFPNLEALIESEHGQPSDDFNLLAKIIPPCVIAFGIAIALFVSFRANNFLYLLSMVPVDAAALAIWYIFDRFDKRIPRSRVAIRKRTKAIEERICAFSNIVGMDPAITAETGEVLDEAARIYLKHRPDPASPEFTNNQSKAKQALEEAMARIMDLATVDARAQKVELEKGWAPALLQEMRDMDRALDAHAQSLAGTGLDFNDPLLQLRQARLELKNVDAAMNELDQPAGN